MPVDDALDVSRGGASVVGAGFESPVERAVVIALHAHRGQVDKAGAPYVLHPLRMMARMTDDDSRMAAYDVIGDIHGYAAPLEALLRRTGYVPNGKGWRAPAGRKAVFVGDLVDRGPNQFRVVEPRAGRLSRPCVSATNRLPTSCRQNGKTSTCLIDVSSSAT
jgi:hypothetical protein